MSIVFSSKWAAENSGDPESPINCYTESQVEDDGRTWHLACNTHAGVTILRVSGSEADIGGVGHGPTGPPNSNATYYLRFTKTNADNNSLYLQTASENSEAEYADLYMGAWWYFESGFRFRDSVKFMDFRGNQSKITAGNGHLGTLGFTHQSYYANTGDYGDTDYTNYAPAWGGGIYEGSFGYLTTSFRGWSSAIKNIYTREGNYNFYDVSSAFDSNLNTSEAVVGRSGYDPANVNRVQISGGKWIAVIFRLKMDATDSVVEAWIKNGTDSLKKVMEWNRNTVWASDDSTPHDFYWLNGTALINHCHFNAYWNTGTGYPATQYMWLANPVVATTYDEVESYLGLTGESASVSPSSSPSISPSRSPSMSASQSPSASPSTSPSASPSEWLEYPRFVLVDSPYITAGGEVTTAQLTAPAGKVSGTHFGAGRIQDDENPTDNIDLTANKYTEIEWCIKATDYAEVDATYQFRATKWLPTDINGCILWLKSNTGITHDGNPAYRVSSWADQSGNGNDATQTTNAAKPVYTTGELNGYPALIFDAVDDLLTTPAFANNQPFTVFMVAKCDGGNYRGYLNNVSGGNVWFYYNGGYITGYAGTAYIISVSVNPTTYKLITFICDGATSRIDINASLGTPGNPGVGNPTGWLIGNGTGPMAGGIVEILNYNSHLSDTNIDLIRGYLNNRYAIY